MYQAVGRWTVRGQASNGKKIKKNKDVRRYVKQGKTRAVKGVRAECSTLL